MKSAALLSLFVCLIFSVCSTKRNEPQEKTTYYFIRHAEKDLSDPSDLNPQLTQKGVTRANAWAEFFSDKKIQYVYSTDIDRTMQTAQPIADQFDLEISLYDHTSLYNSDFQEKTKGTQTVIVGHSNTTPQFINKIVGKNVYEDIDETIYGNLYTVTISGKDISHEMTTME